MKVFTKEYKTKKNVYKLFSYKENPEGVHLEVFDKDNSLNGDKKFKEWFGVNIQMWKCVMCGTLKECEEKLNELILEDSKEK